MRKRSSYSESEKESIILSWQESGLSQRTYCLSEGLSYESFKNFLREYRHRHNIKVKPRGLNVKPEFISLALSESATEVSIPTPAVSFSEIQITYSTGASLKIGSSVDLDQLRVLLTLL